MIKNCPDCLYVIFKADGTVLFTTEDEDIAKVQEETTILFYDRENCIMAKYNLSPVHLVEKWRQEREILMRRGADQAASTQELNTKLLAEVAVELKNRGVSDETMVALRVPIKLAHARNPRKTALEIADMVADFTSASDAKESLNAKGVPALLSETQKDWDKLRGRK